MIALEVKKKCWSIYSLWLECHEYYVTIINVFDRYLAIADRLEILTNNAYDTVFNLQHNLYGTLLSV